MMLVAVAIMAVVGLGLVASVAVKFIRYDPAAKHGAAVSEAAPQAPSAMETASFGIGTTGKQVNAAVATEQADDTPAAELSSATGMKTSAASAKHNEAAPSNGAFEFRLGTSN